MAGGDGVMARVTRKEVVDVEETRVLLQALTEQVQRNAEAWARLVAALDGRNSPPPGKTRPQPQERPRLRLVSERKAA